VYYTRFRVSIYLLDFTLISRSSYASCLRNSMGRGCASIGYTSTRSLRPSSREGRIRFYRPDRTHTRHTVQTCVSNARLLLASNSLPLLPLLPSSSRAIHVSLPLPSSTCRRPVLSLLLLLLSFYRVFRYDLSSIFTTKYISISFSNRGKLKSAQFSLEKGRL
jgi:hypothetical protein